MNPAAAEPHVHKDFNVMTLMNLSRDASVWFHMGVCQITDPLDHIKSELSEV